MKSQDFFKELCQNFNFKGTFEATTPYGDGHINDTYKVTYLDASNEPIHYILQRVNHIIFKDLSGLMENINNVTSYLNDLLAEVEEDVSYDVLTLIKTTHQKIMYKDMDGNTWRAFVFIEGATGHTFTKDVRMLYEAGKAFGYFQFLLADYPVDSLHETIKNFHHTVSRYQNFVTSLEADVLNRRSHCEKEIAFVLQHEPLTHLILDALENKEIPYRVTHNDTKINNVLLDDLTGVGRCVIDLDTVMPGSALYDYGDAIRSCGSTVNEDEENLDLLALDLERFNAYTKGFLETMGNALTEKEWDLLPQSAVLLTFECGMRFLTDYLDGDVYYKIHKKDHNLKRAMNQFRFVQVLEENMDKLINIINVYR